MKCQCWGLRGSVSGHLGVALMGRTQGRVGEHGVRHGAHTTWISRAGKGQSASPSVVTRADVTSYKTVRAAGPKGYHIVET